MCEDGCDELYTYVRLLYFLVMASIYLVNYFHVDILYSFLYFPVCFFRLSSRYVKSKGINNSYC